ncbi:MAG: DUF2267 domain-containing protein [bacterium]
MIMGTMTGLDVFDTTVHKSNAWLKDVMEELGWHDRHKAYLALRSTLHALRDRLLPDESVEFAAQLPMLIRGLYYEGWQPTKTPNKKRHKEEFLASILGYFETDPDVDPEEVARAVFRVLTKRISSGEIQDIKHLFPAELRELWSGPVYA